MSFSKLLENCKKHLKKLNLENLEEVGLDRTLETYYLVGPYPPLMQMEEYHCDSRQPIDIKLNNNESVDLYIHFPYCRVAGKCECSFCHFYKENYNPTEEYKVIDDWIREIELYRKTLGDFNVSTIYFGGGSVSLIAPENLKKFVDYLINSLKVEKATEIKFEIHADASKNPEILYKILDIIKVFDNLKLVIDIQSLNPQTLRYVSWGRVSIEDYFSTLKIVIERGFTHICTGLILGLPFESPESFLSGVSRLITIPEIEMLNIFPLMFKECDQAIDCLKNLPEIMFDVNTRDLVYLATRRLLNTFGFSESPIYFYNRGNTEPTHQRKKFESVSSLIGIGPSAFGYLSDGVDLHFSYYNLPSIKKYAQQLGEQKLPNWKVHKLSKDSKSMRQILMGKLNMLKPFSINMLNENLKDKFEIALSIFKQYGLIEEVSNEWRLTEKGILRVEEMSYFLAEIDLGQTLIADVKETLGTSLHYFPNRTKEQKLKWETKISTKT